jgi:hypothetical protein
MFGLDVIADAAVRILVRGLWNDEITVRTTIKLFGALSVLGIRLTSHAMWTGNLRPVVIAQMQPET